MDQWFSDCDCCLVSAGVEGKDSSLAFGIRQIGKIMEEGR